MSWIDTVVVIIVVVVGLIILYTALKEPLDLLFGLIGRGFGALRDKIFDWRDGGSYYDEIRYG